MSWKSMEKLDNPTQEDWFDIWAEDMIRLGFIDELVTHPDVPTFELFKGLSMPQGKRKNVVMGTVSYTPDRIIRWNPKARGVLFTPFNDQFQANACYFNPQWNSKGKFYYSLVEVKGPAGNQKAFGSDFKFTQKWLWANTQQYVQKVMLMPARKVKNLDPYLWPSTYTPLRYMYSDKLSTNKNRPVPYRTIPNKEGVPLWVPRTLKEFLESKNPTE